MCSHFDLLDEIFSGKAKTNPPYLYESGSTSSAGVDINFITDAIDFDDFDDVIIYDPDDVNTTENRDASAGATDSASANNLISASNLSRAINSARPMDDGEGLASLNCLFADGGDCDKSPARDTVSRMKRALSTIPVNKPGKPGKHHKPPPSTASAIMSDWKNKRIDVISEKNKLLLDKGQREEKWKEAELRLSEEKFNFEKDYRLKELELKRMEIEKEERLAKLKLEMEKEERLQKLKMELEFKLQLEFGTKKKDWIDNKQDSLL